MDEEKLYTEEEEQSFKTIINSIQARCPVYKLNFTNNDPKIILGMYLMCFTPNKIVEKLKEKGITDELHENTLLFFDKHHITELCIILHGVFSIIVSKNIVSKIYEEKYIKDIACVINQPLYYSDIKEMADNIYDSLIQHNVQKEIVYRIKAILENIWFVSYGNMDELINEAKDMYEKESKEEDNNDNNNKTD